MYNSNDSKYYNIANMAKDIAIKIGEELIYQGYYSDDLIGHKYEYDKLKIDYHCDKDYPKRVEIFIDGTRVLECNLDNRKLDYIAGRWTDIIELVHQQIPNVLRQREINKENRRRKIEDLRSLEKELKYYVSCSRNENKLNAITSELSPYDITIIKEKRHNYTRNSIQCNIEDDPYYVFVVYYQNNKVAEFNDSTYNVFRNINESVDHYIPGEWTSFLRIAMAQAKANNDNYIKQKVDDSSDEMIKRLRNNMW